MIKIVNFNLLILDNNKSHSTHDSPVKVVDSNNIKKPHSVINGVDKVASQNINVDDLLFAFGNNNNVKVDHTTNNNSNNSLTKDNNSGLLFENINNNNNNHSNKDNYRKRSSTPVHANDGLKDIFGNINTNNSNINNNNKTLEKNASINSNISSSLGSICINTYF